MIRTICALLLATLLFTCSKAKLTGVDPSANTSAKNNPIILTVGNSWTDDTIAQNDTIYFRVATQTSHNYIIEWNDSSSGDKVYTANIQALAFDSSGEMSYWFMAKDTGYPVGATVHTLDGGLLIRVSEQHPGIFAIRVRDGDTTTSSSSSSNQSSSSSSSCSSYSSSASSSSSNHVIESSSSITPTLTGTPLAVSTSWTQGRLNLFDTMTYVVSVTPNSTYNVQWMDQYDYIFANLNNGAYPTCDVVVSAFNSNGTKLFTTLDDGATLPTAIIPLTSYISIKVTSHYALLDTGSFYIRVYANSSVKKSLAASPTWTEDSTTLAGDTVTYMVPTTIGASYAIQWDDLNNGSGKYSGDVSAFISDSGVTPISLSLWTTVGYSQPIIRKATSTQTWIKLASSKAGKFAIRVYPFSHLKIKTLHPMDSFTKDTLNLGDTIIYQLPTKTSKRYIVSINDYYNGDGTSTAGTSLSYKDNSSNALWGSNFTYTYSYPVTATAVSDTTLIRVVGYTATQAGTFSIRALETMINHDVAFTPSTSWHIQTLIAGDTFTYKIPVMKDSTYRIQWDAYAQGTGKYTANVSMYFKDNTATTWTGEYSTGFTDKVIIKPGSDTLYVRLAGANTSVTGTFAVRVFHPGKIIKNLQLSTQWLTDTLNPADTITYKVPTQAGNTYRIQWADSYESFYTSSFSANVSVQVTNKAGTAYWSSSIANGFSELNTVKSLEDTMLVVVTGAATTTAGNFAIKAYSTTVMNKVDTIQPSSTWTIDSLMGGDVVVRKIPVTQGQDYLIQVDDALSGSATYAGQVQMTCIKSTGVVYKYATTTKFSPGLLVSPTEDTLYLMISSYAYTGGGTYAVRAQVFNPPTLATTSGQSLPLTNSITLTVGQIVQYRIDVTPGLTYQLRWASLYDPVGGTVATAYVYVSLFDSKASLGGPYYQGYSNTVSFTSTQDHIYVSVSTQTAGTFKIGAGTP